MKQIGEWVAEFRGGNVTRRSKTSPPASLAIYLPSGMRISKDRTLLSGESSVTAIVTGLYRASREANSDREFGLGNLSGKVEMDMFGGLTKTSSRIAIAAALGMTLGGFAMSAQPCQGCGSRGRLLRGSRGAGGRA